MAEVLVLAERTGTEAKKVTYELLTLARRFGEPAVVWTGPGADAARDRLAEFGAARVYVADDPEIDGYEGVTGSLPAVVSVVEKINEPRYPTFKGIMAAKKKPVQTLTLADLSVDAGSVGLANAASWVEDFAKRPPRAAGVVVKDEGDGGVSAAEFLAARKFI